MYNSIILSCSLFSSVFTYSISLILINKALITKKKIPFSLIIINGVTFLISGYIFMYSLTNHKFK